MSNIKVIENPRSNQVNYEEDPSDHLLGIAANPTSASDMMIIENPRVVSRPEVTQRTDVSKNLKVVPRTDSPSSKENPYIEDKNLPKVDLGDNIIQGMSGSGVQVVLEFPANDYQSSVYFVAKDILTVSHSVSRSKLPVTNLGEASMSGMSIGSRMVAGSIIKLFSRYDSLSTYVKTFVATRWDKLNEKDKEDISTTGTSI
jgi:hypothetical protein